MSELDSFYRQRLEEIRSLKEKEEKASEELLKLVDKKLKDLRKIRSNRIFDKQDYSALSRFDMFYSYLENLRKHPEDITLLDEFILKGIDRTSVKGKYFVSAYWESFWMNLLLTALYALIAFFFYKSGHKLIFWVYTLIAAALSLSSVWFWGLLPIVVFACLVALGLGGKIAAALFGAWATAPLWQKLLILSVYSAVVSVFSGIKVAEMKKTWEKFSKAARWFGGFIR